ncbi:MAG: YybH family protein [Acidimicrobiales bacterium]
MANYGAGSANRLPETVSEGAEGARAALETFYYALNNQDAATLEAVWADDPQVVLYNPLGGIVRGRGAIGDLYRKVFDSGRGVQVFFVDVVEHVGPDHALFVGRETGSYTAIDGAQVPLHIRTSRYFRRDGKWCQYHHHGSIDDPDALADYQSAVGG